MGPSPLVGSTDRDAHGHSSTKQVAAIQAWGKVEGEGGSGKRSCHKKYSANIGKKSRLKILFSKVN